MARKTNKQKLPDLKPLSINPVLQTQTDIDTPDDATGYFSTYNSSSLLDLTAMKEKAEPDRILLTNDYTALFNLNNSNTVVSIAQYVDGMNLSVKDKKILDFCIMLLSENTTYKKTEENGYVISFTLSDYLEIFGVSNPTKQTRYKRRQQLKDSLSKLRRVSIKMSKGKKSSYAFLEMGIIDTFAVKNEVITVRLNTDFCNVLINSSISSIPLGLFKLSDNNKNVYAIGRKLATHYSMVSNVQGNRNNIISVKKLLQAAPDICDIETIRETDGRWDRRMKDPLETALNQLEEHKILIWEYCNAKKKPLNKKQLAVASYEVFESMYIKFDFLDFPEQTMKYLKEKKPKRKTAKKVKTKESNQHDN